MPTPLSPEMQSLDRRAFLKTGAAGGAALLIGFHIPARASDPAQEQEKPPINPLMPG
jgi:hypothetical protein